MKFSRRTFMKLAAVGGASFAAETGMKEVGKLVPYVVPPEKLSPVEWKTLATTCRECPAGCGMHIRHINGRITKAEGNPVHPVNRGGLCPRGQSSLQGVYDPDRAKEVQARQRTGPFQQESWKNAFIAIGERLQKAAPGRVAMISRLETGTLAEIMSSFVSSLDSNRLLFFEAFHYGPLRKAHRTLTGNDSIPYYNLEQCKYIVSFGADFLESWISNVQFAYQFSEMHKFEKSRIGRFDYVGPRLSMTAGNADRFIPVAPGRLKDVALAMLKILHDENLLRTGAAMIGPMVRGIDIHSVANALPEDDLRQMARRFAQSPSVALAGPIGAIGAEAEQLALVVTLLNLAVGTPANVMDFSRIHALSHAAHEEEFNGFLKGITPNDIVIIHKTNPVYTRPGSEEYLKNAGLIVYLGTMMDETADIADWVLPVHDDLECWGEYEPWSGVQSLMQPTMTPLADSTDAGDVLIKIAAASGKVLRRKLDGSQIETTYDWLRERWRSRYPSANWEESVRNGGSWSSFASNRHSGLPDFARRVQLNVSGSTTAANVKEDEAHLWLWSSIMLFDGRTANRGWMQEAPEPISTITWGNWVDLHPKKAELLKIRSGDIVELAARDDRTIQAQAWITEDVAEEVVAVSFGQGHSALGSIAANVGANAFKLLSSGVQQEGLFGSVKIRKTGRTEQPARSMTTRDQHHRELLQWKHLEETRTMKPGPLVLPLEESYAKGRDLYKPHAHRKHRWAMTIDLQRCIGCGACAVACYAENNIPVVGREQVIKGRHIPWLRIVPYRLNDHPHRIAWLPMLCQHCDQAPCEPVCPVFAAAHNEEGLNAQIYNRCIGTRYCSNNCPYKVRRFNWVNIVWDKSLTWQLNPEVTVRVRGVMEKCTFCVQRIRNAEYRARRENRNVRDGEIIPACAQTCPAKVFTFGDLLDPDSAVSKITRNDPRRYHVLEELNTKPAITYLFRILQEKKI